MSDTIAEALNIEPLTAESKQQSLPTIQSPAEDIKAALAKAHAMLDDVHAAVSDTQAPQAISAAAQYLKALADLNLALAKVENQDKPETFIVNQNQITLPENATNVNTVDLFTMKGD